MQTGVAEVVGFQMIFLGDKEWGNELMQQIASAHFADHPDVDIIEVHEHAGWFLTWNRDMITIGTANDAAVLGDKATRYLERIRGIKMEYLPEVRRP